MTEIRWHARAGQGAKTAAQLLAEALLRAGKSVQAFPEYGPERRGAPVRAYTRFSGRPIRRHDQVTRPDVVVVLEPSLLVEGGVAEGLGPDGLLLVNAEQPPAGLTAARLACVPATRLATEAGSSFPNLAMAGAVAAALGEPPLAELEDAAVELLGGKVPSETIRAAVAAGFRWLSPNPPGRVIAGRSARPGSGLTSADGRTARTNGWIRAELRSWQQLPPGGAVRGDEAPRPRTGGWRTGQKPRADLSRCVDCLLCWLYCPDSAVLLDGEAFAGFDYDHCKGCEICAAACPVDAIAMVPEETPP